MEVCHGRSNPNAKNITYLLETIVHVDLDSKRTTCKSPHGKELPIPRGRSGAPYLPLPPSLYLPAEKLLDTPKLWLKKAEGREGH